MLGAYVMTEHDILRQTTISDSIGLGSYAMDSHDVERIVVGGVVKDEGGFFFSISAPYPITYRAITPRASEASNLLVPVCASASHVGYGSIRMEPVYMILGQAAGTAAALAIDESTTVQQVNVTALQNRLAADKQILHE